MGAGRTKESYDRHRDQVNADTLAAAKKSREIGPLPKVKRPKVRARCRKSLLDFLETYFPDTFGLAWSDDHRGAVADAERVIRQGGQLALAMPRGSGKTSIAVRAAIWALAYGFRRFVVLIAAEQGLADNLISVLKAELQFNVDLLGDFPEVCYPIVRLENITKRQQGQTLDVKKGIDGKPTLVKLTSDEIVLPTVEGSKCSGSLVRAVGLTGSVRGQIATTGDGKTIRPDLVLIDDAQTRDSAKSPTQTAYREALVNGDVLGLAGPKVKIACMNLCTVIYPNDLSDRFLNAEKNPSWNGRRTRLLTAMPTDMTVWDEYAEVRRGSLRAYKDNRLGNEFYESNRELMDAGAVAAWPVRFNEDEVSAVQHAMNLRIDRPAAFAAEYQNDPTAEDMGEVSELTAATLTTKRNNVPRGTVPRECNRVTAFIDVGQKVLWWAVCGWDEGFGGAVVDYGCWPRQNRSFFAQSDARPSLADVYPGVAEEAAIYKGLTDLTGVILGREWAQAETGAAMRIDRCAIDSGWKTDTVYKFCRQSAFAAILLASKGYAVGPAGTPVDAWPIRPGERRGPSWRLGVPSGASGRLLTFDPNHWKSFVADRLQAPFGAAGCLGVNGDKTTDHEMLFDHLTSEYRTRVSAKGRVWDAWATRPDRNDNHLFDCVVGAAVAASELGAVLSVSGAGDVAPQRQKVKLSDLQRNKRG
jgi:hypothetical protein